MDFRQLRLRRLLPAIVLTIMILSACTERELPPLARVRALMESSPDSALAILDTLTLPSSTSPRTRATYALLMTQARDKNYCFETDDSLISIATDFFDRENEPEPASWSHFYKGLIYYNEENFKRAVAEMMYANMYTEKTGEVYTKAKIQEAMADIYSQSYNTEEALKHRTRAIDLYNLAGKKRNALFALCDISAEYERKMMSDTAIGILDSIFPLISPEDSILLGLTCSSYLRPLLSLKRYDAAVTKVRLAQAYLGERGKELLEYPTIADMFTGMGQADSAKFYLDLHKTVDPDWKNSENYHFAAMRLFQKEGDYKEALREFDEMFVIHGDKVKKVLKNEATFAQRDFYRERTTEERHRSEIFSIVSWFIGVLALLVCLSLFLYHRSKINRKKAELEERIFELSLAREEMNGLQRSLRNATASLDNAKGSLSEKDEKLTKLNSLVDTLFSEHFAVLSALSNDYYEKKDSESIRATIINDFERELNRIKSAEYMNHVRDIVNDCRDNILVKIREQMPRFKESDITFLALLIAGFSPRAVCLLMDLKIGNYYNKRTRLRARITDSTAPDRQLFLDAIG